MVENVFILHLINQESRDFLYKVGKLSVEITIYPHWILLSFFWVYYTFCGFIGWSRQGISITSQNSEALMWVHKGKMVETAGWPLLWTPSLKASWLIPKEVSTGTCAHYWHAVTYLEVLWRQTLITLTPPTSCFITYVAQLWPDVSQLDVFMFPRWLGPACSIKYNFSELKPQS